MKKGELITVSRIEGITPHCETELLNSTCPYIAYGCTGCLLQEPTLDMPKVMDQILRNTATIKQDM
jgi:hypothetical protein